MSCSLRLCCNRSQTLVHVSRESETGKRCPLMHWLGTGQPWISTWALNERVWQGCPCLLGSRHCLSLPECRGCCIPGHSLGPLIPPLALPGCLLPLQPPCLCSNQLLSLSLLFPGIHTKPPPRPNRLLAGLLSLASHASELTECS